MQILHRMVRVGLSWVPRTEVELSVVSTGHEASVDTPAVSTFSLIFSPDDTMGFLPPYLASTDFVTKLLTLLISALAWASSLSGEGPLHEGQESLAFLATSSSSFTEPPDTSVLCPWCFADQRLYPQTLTITGLSSVSTCGGYM